MNIFIAKLSANTTSEDLRTLFSEYGEVESANVIFDKMTGRSKRFGFVEMKVDDTDPAPSYSGNDGLSRAEKRERLLQSMEEDRLEKQEKRQQQ